MLNSKRKTIAISGASDITSLGLSVIDIAERLGKFLAHKNITVVTGATTGFSYWVAKGAHEAGGVVIGFSPAGNATEHKESFRLPNDVFTTIIYTGFGFSGRSQMMLKSADSLFMGPGYVESVNEFLFGVESGLPIGILEGEWKLDEAIRDIIGNRKKDVEVVFEDNAEELITKILN
jgi:uncharacterized protein (TIGR00725 family)